jgi:hypothetical protein
MRRFLIAAVAMLAVALVVPTLASAGPVDLKLYPTAGQFKDKQSGAFQPIGNSTAAQAQWTNKVAETGKFSVLLQKSTPTDDSAFPFAAAVVKGVEGLTIPQLGTIGFSSKDVCGGGSPRFNLAYDSTGDGQADGITFYGCANHDTTPAGPWHHMQADPKVPDFCIGILPSGNLGPCTFDPVASTVVQLAVVADEQGTYYIDNVIAAGKTVGEPNGGTG